MVLGGLCHVNGRSWVFMMRLLRGLDLCWLCSLRMQICVQLSEWMTGSASGVSLSSQRTVFCQVGGETRLVWWTNVMQYCCEQMLNRS